MSGMQSGTMSPQQNALSEDESSDEDVVIARDKTKRKADTDHKNKAFNLTLQERLLRTQDYKEKNIMAL